MRAFIKCFVSAASLAPACVGADETTTRTQVINEGNSVVIIQTGPATDKPETIVRTENGTTMIQQKSTRNRILIQQKQGAR
jgi:hypothetical protein